MIKSYLNKGISTPITITVILALALFVGGITYWYYLETGKKGIELSEIELPKKEELSSTNGLVSQGTAKKICIEECLFTTEKKGVWQEIVRTTEGLEGNIYLLEISEEGTFKITRITEQPVSVLSFAFFEPENKIIWVDDRKKDAKNENWTVYLYDISTREEKELIPLWTENYHLYKDEIVFQMIIDYFKDTQELMLYDIKDNTTSTLFSTSKGYDCFIGYKNKIVFREKNGTVYLYDLDSKQKEILPEEMKSVSNIEIYENYIIYIKRGKSEVIGEYCDYFYTQEEDNFAEIYLYDLSTKETVKLSEIYPSKGLFGSLINMTVEIRGIHKDGIKYQKGTSRWIGPDIDETKTECILLDIETKEEKDITCKK